jgi:hypothetical protein
VTQAQFAVWTRQRISNDYRAARAPALQKTRDYSLKLVPFVGMFIAAKVCVGYLEIGGAGSLHSSIQNLTMITTKTWRLSRFEALETRRVLYGPEFPMPAAAEGEGDPLPDFALVDANTTSPTHEQSVSPRDYLEQVSGWYFGNAS